MPEPRSWTLKPWTIRSSVPGLPDAVITVAYGPAVDGPVEVVEHDAARAAVGALETIRPVLDGIVRGQIGPAALGHVVERIDLALAAAREQ